MILVRPRLFGPSRSTSAQTAKRHATPRRRLLKVTVAVLIGGGVSVIILAGLANLSWYGRERILPAMNNAVTWMQSIPVTPRELSLEIKFKDYQKLAFFREEALEFGKLLQH
ncbi:MAG: hypothetical protein IIB57_13250, partial [Planctomycetes bacterium]|nr:hypothetical protein [Planctomycetota bacterium]